LGRVNRAPGRTSFWEKLAAQLAVKEGEICVFKAQVFCGEMFALTFNCTICISMSNGTLARREAGAAK
jgi:hypothetical protein